LKEQFLQKLRKVRRSNEKSHAYPKEKSDRRELDGGEDEDANEIRKYKTKIKRQRAKRW